MNDPDDLRTLKVILGILLVNDFEISPHLEYTGKQEDDGGVTRSVSIRALFALASMPSHSCLANATHEFTDRYCMCIMTSLFSLEPSLTQTDLKERAAT